MAQELYSGAYPACTNMRQLLPLIILLLAHSAFSQTDERSHPIDAQTHTCIDANPSTQGMLECLGVAYTEWDVELNRLYRVLMGELSDENKEQLRAAQRAWIAFRNAEFDVLASVYGGLEGTLWRVVHADHRVSFIRRRAKELEDYLWSLGPEEL